MRPHAFQSLHRRHLSANWKIAHIDITLRMPPSWKDERGETNWNGLYCGYELTVINAPEWKFIFALLSRICKQLHVSARHRTY
jgi:hypothetical protein